MLSMVSSDLKIFLQLYHYLLEKIDELLFFNLIVLSTFSELRVFEVLRFDLFFLIYYIFQQVV